VAVVRCAAGAEPGARAPQTPPGAACDGPKPERPQPADAPAAKEAEGRITVGGQVIDPDGKPLAGAKLYLGGLAAMKEAAYPVRATSGGDGRFTFTFATSELDTTREDDPAYQVLAIAEGYGCGWGTINSAAKEEVTLRLVKDAPVK